MDWLVLVHHLPPKPDYLRVKVRRRLARLHAQPLRNSVYVLPHRVDTLEDFQWLAGEIRDEGGDAIVCQAQLVDGATDEELTGQFEAHAAELYAAVTSAARSLLDDQLRAVSTVETRASLQQAHARLSAQLDDAKQADFFASAAGEQARAAVDAVRSAANPSRSQPSGAVETEPPRGRVWVTRAGVFVDRMASAWLIRRFIDPDARFKFVSSTRYSALDGELRFDMPHGEFTHEGDACTFEVLCRRFGLTDTGLVAIAEIVHDIDLKDDKFQRPEADGVAVVLRGISESAPDDAARIAIASTVFDGLLAQFRSAK